MKLSIVNGLAVGDKARFFTHEREVFGTVTNLHFGPTQGGYHDITLDVDGMDYRFGTGGHLGQTWALAGECEGPTCETWWHEKL